MRGKDFSNPSGCLRKETGWADGVVQTFGEKPAGVFEIVTAGNRIPGAEDFI